MDEPESALSASRQVALLARIGELLEGGSQFIIATHSPILASLPGALIYSLSGEGLAAVAYEDTDCFRVLKKFFDERATGKLGT
jgi:predicted ATPase